MVAISQLDQRVSVAGQLRPADLGDLAGMGFRAVVNNRPDGEALIGQPPMERIREAAASAGLASHYLPVSLPSLGADEIRGFHAIMRDTDGPLVAYCKSGLRSALLWVLAEAALGGGSVDLLMRRAALAGQDLSRSRELIDRLLSGFAARS